mmetsp:Transcript_15229/g.26382  ORF Transcript_15229/g.26382 Transcript_15229/m.26382 type:complete len:89 (-) Transcript_15229:1342-1608(-)
MASSRAQTSWIAKGIPFCSFSFVRTQTGSCFWKDLPSHRKMLFGATLGMVKVLVVVETVELVEVMEVVVIVVLVEVLVRVEVAGASMK